MILLYYFHKNKGIKNENLPKLFVSIEDYAKRKEDKRLKELSKFEEYLDYCMDMDIFN